MTVYEPLYVGGKRDKARRFVNPSTGEIISRRQYIKLTEGASPESKAYARYLRGLAPKGITAKKYERRLERKAEKERRLERKAEKERRLKRRPEEPKRTQHKSRRNGAGKRFHWNREATINYKVDIGLETLEQVRLILLLDIPPLPALNVMVRSYKSSVVRRSTMLWPS